MGELYRRVRVYSDHLEIEYDSRVVHVPIDDALRTLAPVSTNAADSVISGWLMNRRSLVIAHPSLRRRVAIDSGAPDSPLADAIEERIKEKIVPRLNARLDAGETLSFGLQPLVRVGWTLSALALLLLAAAGANAKVRRGSTWRSPNDPASGCGSRNNPDAGSLSSLRAQRIISRWSTWCACVATLIPPAHSERHQRHAETRRRSCRK